MAVVAVGVHWAANRPVCPYSLSITSSLCPPPPTPPQDTLVAFIITQKSQSYKFSLTVILQSSWCFLHNCTAHRICKYNLDTLPPIVWPLQNLSIPPFLLALHLPAPKRAPQKKKKNEKRSGFFFFLLSSTLF